MATQNTSQRLEFDRATRVSQFIRAIIVIAVGAAIFFAAFNLDRFISLPENSPVGILLRCFGGFVAISGVIAIFILTFMMLSDTRQVIEVDETGLTVSRESKKPSTRSLKWADVTSYEVIDNTSFLDLTSSTPYTSSQDSDLTGCLVGFFLEVYIGLLQLFIGGSSTTIKFKLKAKRVMKISGFGAPMDDLIYKVLPHYIPDNSKDTPVQLGGRSQLSDTRQITD